MNQAYPLGVRIVLLSATALSTSAVLSLPPIHSYTQSLIPESYHLIPAVSKEWYSDYETYTRLTYINDNSNAQIGIMLEFARKLIQNSEDLKPEVVHAINQHFWELF